jgi:hypothetical protein
VASGKGRGMIFKKLILILLLVLVLHTRASPGQDAKVYKNISMEKVEEILKGLAIDFKKTPSPTNKKLTIFTFERNKYKLALHAFAGQDLMLVAEFPAVPLAYINQWNRGAQFSRAVLYQDAKNDFSALEANLDVAGGVTDDTIRHFIRRYDDEIKRFDKLLFPAAVREEEVVTKVPSDRLEKILKGMEIPFKKIAGKEADTFSYEFERDTFKVRLHNFKGEDLMLQAAFKAIPPTDVNKYNFNRKFIRVVLYQPEKGKSYTALETNLDCQGGVSDRIIRYFIDTFDGELIEFAKFIAK